MEELGLAAGMSQQEGVGQVPAMRDINQVVAMLRQGTSPEELVMMGVPEEVVQEAMRLLSQQATAVPQEGLAGMVVPGGL